MKRYFLYEQFSGGAMGSPLSPIAANLFKKKFEMDAENIISSMNISFISMFIERFNQARFFCASGFIRTWFIYISNNTY